MEKKLRWRNRDSVFSRTMLMLSLLSLITVLAMYVFVNHIVTAGQHARFQTVHSDQLKQVAVYVDGQISAMEQNNSQILHSNDTISLMVNPMLKDSDVGYHVVSALKNCAEQNRMTAKAFLYLPTTGEVYSSVGNFLSLEDSSNRGDIEQYLAERERNRKPGAESEHRLLFRMHRLFVVTDFCVPNFIGVLFQEVDLALLNSQIQSSEEESTENFFMTASSGDIILAEDSHREELKKVLEERSYTDTSRSGSGGRGDYMICPSSENTLVYGLHIDTAAEKIGVGQILMTILPFLLVYAVFSVVYSLYITRRIYLPINRLMQITAAERSDMNRLASDRGRNEMEILEEAFQSTLGENRQHKELLADISQDVLSQMFRGILTGTTVDAAYIENRMEGLGLSRYRNGRYVALAGTIRPKERRDLSSVEEGLYQRSLLAVLAECQQDSFLMSSFFMDADYLAVLLCFTQEESAIQMKSRAAQLTEMVKEKVEPLPYGVLFGMGKIYNEISSMRFSWQEALEEVQYQIYLKDTPQQEQQARPVRTDDADLAYFREQAVLLTDLAEKERGEELETVVDSLVKEICHSDRSRRQAVLETMMDVLVEKLIEVHVTQEEIHGMGLEQSVNRIMQETDGLAESGQMKGMFLAIVKMIHTNSRKNRYKYVDAAKDYISTHYSDGNLSLNEVSEAVGISAPYLSAIFAEISKGGFSAYLSSYRIETARRFLEETSQNVAEIGYKCGFNSAQSFSRVFKKITGVAPGQYRDRFSRGEGKTGE